MARETLGEDNAIAVDLVFEVGVDNEFLSVLNDEVNSVLEPVDLTGWTATSQIRTEVGGTILLDMTSMIVLGADGSITITVPALAASTPALRNAKKGVWDLKLIEPDNKSSRWASGFVTFIQDVTRSV